MSLDTNSSNFITDLITNSSDAMQNLYYVEFIGLNEDNMAEAFKVRLQNIKPPVFTHNKNSVSYLAVSMDMPGSEISGDKILNLTFRLDSNYKLYKALLKYQATTMVANQGWVTTRVPNSDNGLTIKIYAFDRNLGSDPDSDECYRQLYSFLYCWMPTINGLSLTYDNDTPMTVNADVRFMDYEDPMNLLLGKV